MVARWHETRWHGLALTMPSPNWPSRGLAHIKGAHHNSVDLAGEADTEQETPPALMVDAMVENDGEISVLVHPVW